MALTPSPLGEYDSDIYAYIEGYKGVTANLTAQGDFQYSVGEIYTFDKPIVVCHSGFHFCRSLSSVFSFYPIGDGNRFFKIQAIAPIEQNQFSFPNPFRDNDKIAAKTIRLVEEVSNEEVFAESDLPQEYWELARSDSLNKAYEEYFFNILSNRLAPPLARYLARDENEYRREKAAALLSQENLSIDTIITIVFQ